MKKYLFYLSAFTTLSGYSQVLDTIYSNTHSNSALFFPEKIRQAVVGGKNFLFSYNEEIPQYFGLLKALPGPASNLLVVTTRGTVYAYVVAHKEKPNRLIYFFDSKDRIGLEKPVEEKKSVLKEQVNKTPNSKEHFQKLANYFIKASSKRLKKKRKEKMSLQVDQLKYEGDQVYMIFTIENRSDIEFEPEYLRVFLAKGNRRRNASYQRILQTPVFKSDFPNTVPPAQFKKFVYVLPKFTLGSGQRVEVELREKKGNRFLQMSFR